jgi:hypothetical protein
MALIPRTLPTRLGAEDKLVDLYVIGLTLFQVLNILGGAAVAVEILEEPALSGVLLTARQGLAALALVAGACAAFWRYEGHSVWAWLWMAARFSRLPRHAISRPALVVLDDGPDNRWYEVRPPLDWCDRPTSHRQARGRTDA